MAMNNDYAKRIAESVREAAAKVCDGVNNYDNPMTAMDCADAIRSLDRDAIIASVPKEAPAEQPEDERSRFEAAIRKRSIGDRDFSSPSYAWAWFVWQAAKRDALTQAPQERAADISEALRMLGNTIPFRMALIRRGECVDASLASIQSAILIVRDTLLSLAQSSEGKKPCGS
jgi:hypothetical protein